MKHTFAVVGAILMLAPHPSYSNAGDDAFRPLETKITKSLTSDRWHDISKTFVQAVWKDYKSAHVRNRQDLSKLVSIAGKLPDVKTYDEYVGRYARKVDAKAKLILEVAKTSEGRFVVKLQGHTIPAVPVNGGILLTTGDVVQSRLPQLGEKPYAALEMFTVVRLEGKYFMSSPGEQPREEAELVKLDK